MLRKPTEAYDFLQRFRPQGPWTLVSILADNRGGRVNGKTFEGDCCVEVVEWIDHEQDNGRNIYFHVNPLTRPLDDKAKRSDIKSVDWFHVDVDPRAGEDIEDERRRIRAMLDNLPGLPRPTVIVFSGGGFQAFWRLLEPIEVDGEVDAADEAGLYNRQIEVLCGADHCHNVDRVMRLPFTTNIPSEKKRKRGQTTVMAELVEFNDLAYSVSDFTPAQLVRQDNRKQQRVEIEGNVRRIEDLEELDKWLDGDAHYHDRIKATIVQGFDPNDPHKHESRSEWVHWVCCELVRCSVPDEVIYSVITDPDFAIASQVLDKGGRSHDYALRQILRAKEKAIDPFLAEMNDKHAVIGNWAGRCRVMEELWDPTMDRYRVTSMSFEDVRNRYSNRTVKVGEDKDGNTIYKKLGHFWLDHQHRRQFDQIVFAPNGKAGENNYNLWTGWGVEAKPGSCEHFKWHLQFILCGGNKELFQFCWNWLAQMVQKPWFPAYAAMVLKGEQGAGKSIVPNYVGKMVGRHYLQVSSASHVVGNFNAHLRDVILLFLDEALYAGDHRHRSIMKALVTEETIAFEGKGKDVEFGRNHLHIIMASNDDWVIGAERGDRRFLVLEVDSVKRGDKSYFEDLINERDNGGTEALLYELMHTDLTGFNVRDVPKTDALREQQRLSLSAEERWWYNCLWTGTLSPTHDAWEEAIFRHELTYEFAQAVRGKYNGDITAAGLGRFLCRMLGCTARDIQGKQHRTRKVKGLDVDGKEKMFSAPWEWRLPELSHCRKSWEEQYGDQEWPDAGEGFDGVDEETHEEF